MHHKAGIEPIKSVAPTNDQHKVQWNLIITATYGPNIPGHCIEVATLQRCKCVENELPLCGMKNHNHSIFCRHSMISKLQEYHTVLAKEETVCSVGYSKTY